MSVDRLDTEQAEKAFKALLEWHKTKTEEKEMKTDTKSLFSDSEKVHLQIQLKKTPQSGNNIVPKPVPIPHPVNHKPEICVIVRDPLVQYQKKFDKSPIDGVKLIIPMSQLRKEHKEFQAKRKLANSYDLFFADQAIQKFLPKLLGKAFYSTKKQPMLITFNRDWAQQILKGINSTNLFIGTGACFSVLIGRTDWEVDHLVENSIAVMKAVASKIPKKWDSIQCISVKSASSPALPIYNALPISVLRPNLKAPVAAKVEPKTEVDATKEEANGEEAEEDVDEEEEEVEEVQVKKEVVAKKVEQKPKQTQKQSVAVKPKTLKTKTVAMKMKPTKKMARSKGSRYFKQSVAHKK